MEIYRVIWTNLEKQVGKSTPHSLTEVSAMEEHFGVTNAARFLDARSLLYLRSSPTGLVSADMRIIAAPSPANFTEADGSRRYFHQFILVDKLHGLFQAELSGGDEPQGLIGA